MMRQTLATCPGPATVAARRPPVLADLMLERTTPAPTQRFKPKRVLLLGATGTIGRATARALVGRGHDVVCFVRPRAGSRGALAAEQSAHLLAGATLRFGNVTAPPSLARDGFRDERFDIVVSCLASRTGAPRDAWAIDHGANSHALATARERGVTQFVLLSAICVQKPLLAFQQAKLAFEKELIDSGLPYSIVRPTAFFKSLSGQVERVRRGKPFVVFGDGMTTACKPISDADLACYLADCLDDESRRDRVLPIGGPGDAITPREQGEHLFRLLGRPPRFTHVPVRLLDAVIWGLATLGRALPTVADKAELARIGRYYATESMLVLDPATGRYDASATPSTGTETLFDFYARLVAGEASVERGDHAVF
jgi:divinyl chlorophyllide a 8-vinyl-reductase